MPSDSADEAGVTNPMAVAATAMTTVATLVWMGICSSMSPRSALHANASLPSHGVTVNPS